MTLRQLEQFLNTNLYLFLNIKDSVWNIKSSGTSWKQGIDKSLCKCRELNV